MPTAFVLFWKGLFFRVVSCLSLAFSCWLLAGFVLNEMVLLSFTKKNNSQQPIANNQQPTANSQQPTPAKYTPHPVGENFISVYLSGISIFKYAKKGETGSYYSTDQCT